MPSFKERLQHAWNVFNGRDRPQIQYVDYGPSSSYRPDRVRMTRGVDRSIVNAIYTRIALDVASMDMHHVRLDFDDNYQEVIKDGLENIMSLEANIDQTGFAYTVDLVLSMFDEGVVAEVPVETDIDPSYTSGYEILQMRTARVLEWRPRHVRMKLYNDRTGNREEIILPKDKVSIIENPFYAVMNEPMGVLQRLIRKMNLLDATDEQNGAEKMNMIIQLPYVIKSEAQRKTANNRLSQIESQLKDSKYGIAYTDGTEKIIQLNRPLENNLMGQIEYLTNMLYAQLGITASIMDGTADEKTMLNYYSRTIEPILSAIANERKRKFLSKTARTRGESIMYFRNPFKLVPLANLADIADKLTRNAILSSNEIRAAIGYKPVDTPLADELSNKNMPQQDQPMDVPPEDYEIDQNGTDLGENPYGY